MGPFIAYLAHPHNDTLEIVVKVHPGTLHDGGDDVEFIEVIGINGPEVDPVTDAEVEAAREWLDSAEADFAIADAIEAHFDNERDQRDDEGDPFEFDFDDDY